MEVEHEQTTESKGLEKEHLAAQDLPGGELVDQAVKITDEAMPSKGIKGKEHMVVGDMVDGDMVDGDKEEFEMKPSKLATCSTDKLPQSKIVPKVNNLDVLCKFKTNCSYTNDRGEPAQYSTDIYLENEKIQADEVVVDAPDLTVETTKNSKTPELQSTNTESQKMTNQWTSELKPQSTVMRNCSSQTSPMGKCRKKQSKSCQQLLVPRCLIHSIPKLINCLTCKEQCCAQCLLIEGLCYSKGHLLTEASHIAKQREKLKLMKSLESASSDLNQLELYARDMESELQDLEVKRLLRREEIHQEFTSIIDLLTKRRNCVLRHLDEEVAHRKQYLESKLKTYQNLQQAEVQLTEEVTTLVQTTCDQNHAAFINAYSECEKFSSKVKSSELPQQTVVTSLLDNPFSLYREKSQIDNALKRDTIANGELRFKQKTMYIDWRDKLVLEKLLDIPCFPTSSRQTFTVEMFLSSFRRKVWHTSVPTLEGLVLSSDQPGFLIWPLFGTVLLRVRVRISIETSDMKYVIKESRPTHMMICATKLRLDDNKAKRKCRQDGLDQTKLPHYSSNSAAAKSSTRKINKPMRSSQVENKKTAHKTTKKKSAIPFAK